MWILYEKAVPSKIVTLHDLIKVWKQLIRTATDLTGGEVDVESLEALLEAVAGEQLAVDGVVLALQVVQLQQVVADHLVDLWMEEKQVNFGRISYCIIMLK